MDEIAIGANIRKIRLAKKTSLTDLAKRANIAKGTLSKIENGQTSSPISTLLSIASALGVHLADFVKEDEPATRCVFTPANQRRLIVRDGSQFGYAYEGLAVGYPGRRVEPFILTIGPDDEEGCFQHGGQEFLYLLSGSIEFTVGNETFAMQEGDSLYFDPTLPHKTHLVGNTPARLLCCFIQND